MWELLDWNNEWLYNRLEDTNFDRHFEAAASYADLRANVETFVQKATETKDLTEQGVKDMQTAIEKLSTDQGTQLSSVLKALQDLQTEFKDDHVLVSKLLEFMESHKATSRALSELPALFKSVDIASIKAHQEAVNTTLTTQHTQLTSLAKSYDELSKKHNELVNCYTSKISLLTEAQQTMSTDISGLKTETSEIKGMVSDILKLLQSSSSQQLDPQRRTSGSMSTTDVITEAIPLQSFMPPPSTTSALVLTNPILTEATTTTEVPEPATTIEVPEPSVSNDQPTDKGKAIMTTDVSIPKLVNAPKEVRPDPDAPAIIEIILHNGKVFRGTNEQVAVMMEREDIVKAELLSKPVIAEAKMIQEANKKAKLITERKQRNYERYVWTMTKTKGEGPITDILIHPFKKGEPLGASVQRGPRVNEVYTPFKLSDFGIKEWDMIGPILKKKKNKCIPELLGNLTKKYQELEKVAKSLGIDHQKALDSQGLAIPTRTQVTGRKRKVVEQEPEDFIAALHCNRALPAGVRYVPNKTSPLVTGRKRKVVEQEPEDFIAALHCNRALPAGVRYVPNKVIKEPEYGLFFIDELKEKAFQRVSDIHLVDITTLLAYKMMARQFRSAENEEFMLLMDNERPNKDILLTKKAKLELMGMKEVWDKVRDIAEIEYDYRNWNELLKCLAYSCVQNSIVLVVKRLALAASVYTIWQERNGRIFKDVHKTSQEVFNDIADIIRHKLLGITVKNSVNVRKVEARWNVKCKKADP
ncbi:hypothetical protein CTI12_AA455900 [Artemisia annua]|uniref:Reverse transcriptase domain-containing protein n=1 Tax=Artemisia annua TaxID=35608 RepID=A0A2U1LTM4_ARTAN|nr:hypothetical protein CTI12_AA455900 [Artemisia annua]